MHSITELLRAMRFYGSSFERYSAPCVVATLGLGKPQALVSSDSLAEEVRSGSDRPCAIHALSENAPKALLILAHYPNASQEHLENTS